MEHVLRQVFGGGLLGELGSQAILKTYPQHSLHEDFMHLKTDKQKRPPYTCN